MAGTATKATPAKATASAPAPKADAPQRYIVLTDCATIDVSGDRPHGRKTNAVIRIRGGRTFVFDPARMDATKIDRLVRLKAIAPFNGSLEGLTRTNARLAAQAAGALEDPVYARAAASGASEFAAIDASGDDLKDNGEDPDADGDKGEDGGDIPPDADQGDGGSNGDPDV